MTKSRAAAWLVSSCAFVSPVFAPADAGAQGYEATTNLAIAAEYWGEYKYVEMVNDQAFLDRWAVEDATDIVPAALAIINGEKIWYGNWFLSQPDVIQCQVVVHEYGHTIGYYDDGVYAEDIVGVMRSDSIPAECAATYLAVSAVPPTRTTRRQKLLAQRNRCIAKAKTWTKTRRARWIKRCKSTYDPHLFKGETEVPTR